MKTLRGDDWADTVTCVTAFVVILVVAAVTIAYAQSYGGPDGDRKAGWETLLTTVPRTATGVHYECEHFGATDLVGTVRPDGSVVQGWQMAGGGASAVANSVVMQNEDGTWSFCTGFVVWGVE